MNPPRRVIGILLALGVGLATQAEAQSRIESRDRDTEFVGWVEPDKLYWRPFLTTGLQEAEFKLLSFSESTRARSQITRLPPGWSHPAGYHTQNEEIFVLSGDLIIGDKQMIKYSYAYYPAGYAHGAARSENGATLLHWWNGDPDFVASSESKAGTRIDEVVEGWNYYSQPVTSQEDFPRWAETLPPPDLMQLKLMRMDKRTGAMTWMNNVAGDGSAIGPGAWEVHPSWEESMLLEGELTYGECLPGQGEVSGTYRPGGYFFRPANIRHGGQSSFSDSYALFIFRTDAPIWADFYAECDQPSDASKVGTGP